MNYLRTKYCFLFLAALCGVASLCPLPSRAQDDEETEPQMEQQQEQEMSELEKMEQDYNQAAEPAPENPNETYQAPVPPPPPTPLNDGGPAGTMTAPAVTSTPTGEELVEILDFNDADLRQVINLYSQYVKKGYIMQPGISGRITLKSPPGLRLTLTEAISILESALNMHNFVILPINDKYFKVIMNTQVTNEGVGLAPDDTTTELEPSEKIVSQLVVVENVDAGEVFRALTGQGNTPGQPIMTMTAQSQYMHHYGRITLFPKSNALLITDTANVAISMMKLIKYLDTTVEEDRLKIRFFPLTNAEPADVVSIINTILSGGSTQPGQPTQPQPGQTAPNIPRRGRQAQQQQQQGDALSNLTEGSIIAGAATITTDERTRQIIIVTREKNFPFFEDLIEKLDVNTAPEFETKIYRLSYAKAVELSTLLSAITQQNPVQNLIESVTGTPRNQGTSQRQDRLGTSGASSRYSRSNRNQNQNQQQQGNQRQVPNQVINNLLTNPNSQQLLGALSEPGTLIVPDERSNSLIISASQRTHAAFVKLLDELDKFIPEVIIDVVIAEVSNSDIFDLGTSLYGPVQQHNSHMAAAVSQFTSGRFIDPSTLTTPSSFTNAPGSFTLYGNLFGGDLGILVQAFESTGDFHVLQRPRIHAANNEPARIFIGESRPVITGTSESTTQTRSTYEYVDIGVDLRVTAQINSTNGVVTLEISQTVDDAQETVTIDGNEIPIIRRREAEANKIVTKDGSIIILGGIMTRSMIKSQEGIPYIARVPLLGELFKHKNKQDRKSELVILLRPKVLNTPEEAQVETLRKLGTNRHWKKVNLDQELEGKIKQQKEADALENKTNERKSRRSVRDPK